jgi:hypothetical protein
MFADDPQIGFPQYPASDFSTMLRPRNGGDRYECHIGGERR